MLPYTVSLSRTHHLAVAVARAVATHGDAFAPAVQTMIWNTAQQLVDAGAGVDAANDALRRLFVALAAPYEEPRVLDSLAALETRVRAFTLERAGVQPIVPRRRSRARSIRLASTRASSWRAR